MAKNIDPNLRSISSFSDFVIERKRLNLKRKLLEARLKFNADELRKIVSLNSNISFDLMRSIIPQFSGIFDRIFKSDNTTETNDTSDGV